MIFFFFFFFFFLCIFFLGLRFGFAQDKAKIDNWVKQFKLANPGMSQAQVDAYESPDRLDWGHPNLKNCFFCAGQCFNNPDDNTMCQVSQSNPFGNGQKRSLVNVTQVLRQPNYEARYPEIAKAHKAGIELIESMSQSHGKRNVEAMCGAAEANELTLIIPGFGRRFHCGLTCLNNDTSRAPTPSPTPHPGQIGEDHMPTPQPIFGQETTTYTGVPVITTPKPGVVIINSPTPANNNNIASGVSCSKEGEVCGMAGNTKLFCKCKVCGFKGDKCAGVTSSLSFMAAAAAMLAAAARFL
jgi:hypothetical protein